MGRYFQQSVRLPLGLLVLAWPLLCIPQDAGHAGFEEGLMAQGQTHTGPNLSVYDTLVFDVPVPLREGGEEISDELQQIYVASLQPEEGLIGEQLSAMQNLQRAISEIELVGGPWDLGLTENLVAMGELYEQQGAFDEATDTYLRAMHISRVNLGLNSLDHIPVAERLVGVYLAQGDLENADQYQEYLYYAQRQVFGLEDPRMVPVLERLARWKLSIFNAGYGDKRALHLVSALRLFQAASNLVSINFGSSDERFAKYQRDTAGTAYLVSRYRRLIEETPMTEFRVIKERYPLAEGVYNAAFVEGYEEGLNALQAIVDSYAEEQRQSEEYANALIHLADWYLLYDRHRSAGASYQQAYEVLAGLENGEELIRQAFTGVKPLPDFSQEIASIFIRSNMEGREQVARGSGYIDVRFDVTPYGSAANLDVLTEDDQVNVSVLSTLRRKIRATTFRPTIRDGETVRSEGNLFRYRFVY